ncbi:PucR family transcriptional regulator [Microbispora sp. KK1-11]|uniref:PucR family transcriptional regulator n=1 Tax=Microbispora sp. KK1-11 TaxID=2053005 RepID=UPI0011575FFF|nr:PucR family transcriptional regulator [Microbispora sp. KK1-11]TQS28141.1 PucR family transcriptional regulator [Microbispora sp. KK1-11]
MPLTVADVLAMPMLEITLIAGRDGLGNHVRWAHVTELADPVPWLRGGELVMTVGLGLPASARGRAEYVERLSGARCAALAFALDEHLTEIPPEIVEAAARLGLPLLEVTGRTPFIAVAEAVARWHADERVRGERRAAAAQEAMARAALRHGSLGILRALAEHTDCETLLLDPRGRPRVSHPEGARPWHAEAAEAVGQLTGPRGSMVIDKGDRVLQVQSLGFTGPPRGWLALHGATTEWHTRILANQAASLLAIELVGLHRARARAHAQRAAVLSAVLDGAVHHGAVHHGAVPNSAAHRAAAGADPAAPLFAADRLAEICPMPPPPYEVIVAVARVEGEAPALADPALDALSDIMGDPAAEETVFVCPRAGGLLLVVPQTDPRLGPALVERLGALTGLDISAGACGARDIGEIASAVRHATALAGGEGYTHVDDLEPWALLRDALDPEGVARFADVVLKPLREHDLRHGGALVSSVRAFLDCGASVEAAARRLGVHRNTMRARLQTAERVCGRDLGKARDRLELWLALSLDEFVPPGRRN